ncbi:HAMP domain-containing protein [Streptomyces bambusae]|uniref:ATP-binding protein n=1 Tax=Streptomyces bambusae TaxID=1550616 RepID=UPI001D001029|nr:ATP-binding protein [Streptomyces bambusae]MCB5169511.1 HAMP domain-containing protein [Streptomyces bambusae]
MKRFAPLGLRTRLIAGFLLVAAISALTTAALAYREARSAVLRQTQDTAVASMRDVLDRRPIRLPYTRSTDLSAECRDIARLAKPHPWAVFAEYGTMRASSGNSGTSTVITPELRKAAHEAPRAVFQRVVKDGTPYLTFGMPAVMDYRGERIGTGAVFYGVMAMNTEQTTIDAMVLAARDGALPGLAISVIPALLAARSVLRPVRDMRRAARRMGEGRLDTRIEVKGRDELAELARTFNETAGALEASVQELQQAEARARRFAADVSHELRTPLAGMLAVTEVLDEDAARLDPDTAAAVRLVSAETGKLAHLVDDLMEISRFDARAAELHTDEVDMAETIAKTLERRHWLEQVHTDVPDGLRARLDPRRFDVVLANLVGNALRHGGGPVRIRVYAEARPGGPWLLTEVADSGPGIAPEVLPHIFDRFYKADAARTRSAGSGLGLAITLENVRLHGGTIRAANGPYGGAVFTVEMPWEART